jgi:hypothetical protein
MSSDVSDMIRQALEIAEVIIETTMENHEIFSKINK